jgi:hypothetical protein
MSAVVGPLVYEEQVVVTAVPASTTWGIANLATPTDTEIGTGTDLSSYIPKSGGIGFPSTRNAVDTSTIDRTFNSEYPGSRGGPLTLQFKMKNRDGNTAAWDLLKAGVVALDIVIGYEGSNGTAGDEVDIWRGFAQMPLRNNPAPDEEQRFTVEFRVQEDSLAVAVTSGS